jgi:hypothetical protein
MPTTKIELDNRNKSFDRVIDGRNVEEHLGVTHEAVED